MVFLGRMLCTWDTFGSFQATTASSGNATRLSPIKKKKNSEGEGEGEKGRYKNKERNLEEIREQGSFFAATISSLHTIHTPWAFAISSAVASGNL